MWHVLHTAQNFEKYALEFISSIKDLKGSNWNFEAHKANKINKVIDGFRSHDMIAGRNSIQMLLVLLGGLKHEVCNEFAPREEHFHT